VSVVVLASALFALGLYAMLVRRDLIGILAGIEVMLAGSLLALVGLGAASNGGATTGSGVLQGVGVIVLVVAAAEAAVGFALLVALARTRRTTDVDELTEVRG
jgi:NADH-quinone oxidoreductase subunit K